MGWQAELKSKEIVAGNIRVSILYDDGLGNHFAESVSLNPDTNIGDIVRDRIIKLNEVSSSYGKIVTGPITPSAPPTGPSPLELANQDLRRALVKYDDAVKIQAANPSFDMTPYKQAIIDAEAAVQAASK